ncbi:MAG: RsmB/NOP family class I SAM-dependent RNA methyltransferase [Candidatus Bathyarchaeota archaeon]
MLQESWMLAIKTLCLIELKRLSERLALRKVSKKLKVNDKKAIGLAHRLVSETLRKRNYIDFLINSVLAPQSLKDYKIGTRSFLRLYTHEIKVSNGDFELALKIARMGRKILGWKYLNDVEIILGEILSINSEKLINQQGEIKKVSLQTFHPKWFVKYCFRLLGRGEALNFLEQSTRITPLYIRINTLKESEKMILNRLEKENVILEKVKPLKYSYKINGSDRDSIRSQSFKDGLFYVQDKASCLAAEIANPQKGMTVFDVCAAPGSKTTFLAQLMENQGTIFSFDYSKRRIQVLKRETQRMGVKIDQPILADSRKNLPSNVLADLVILDPPCTSTGTFGKTPEAKWRLTKRSIRGMAKIQSKMIDECAKHVKNGGFLIYSTCSITLEENEMIIENFLRVNPEFSLTQTKPRIGLPGLRGLTKCQRLYPHIHHCNGFFIAKLKKEV